ncbi:MAG: hypothetical protein ACLPVW_10745 [Terriglobales bacterium]
MTRTVKEQVKTGFRLAGGIVLFVLSVLFLAYGLDAVWTAVPPGHLVWGAWIGWSELLAAAVLIPTTAHLWLQYFAGCVGFGFLKSLVVIFAGKDWYSPHASFSRLEATEMTFFLVPRSPCSLGLLGNALQLWTESPLPYICSFSSVTAIMLISHFFKPGAG